MSENLGFTERAIAKAQKLPAEDLFCQSITDYLFRHGRLAYDLTHKLWWVKLPNGTWNVAVWMPAEPLEDADKAALAVSSFAKAFG